jgi:hypothetical protein
VGVVEKPTGDRRWNGPHCRSWSLTPNLAKSHEVRRFIELRPYVSVTVL